MLRLSLESNNVSSVHITLASQQEVKVFYSGSEVGALLNNLAQSLLFRRGKRFGKGFSIIGLLHKLSHAHLSLHHVTPYHALDCSREFNFLCSSLLF